MSELIEIKLYDLIELSLCISDCDLDQEETITYVYNFLSEMQLDKHEQ